MNYSWRYMYTFLSTDTVGPDLIAPAPVKMATNHSPLSLDYAVEIILIIPYIGVVFPLMRLISLDRYHLYFLMILKSVLTFLPLSNPVLQ